MNKLYTKTIIFLFALIFAIGIIIPFDLVHKSIDILEGVGQGFSNLHTLYINSSDSSPDGGIVEDTVQNDDPEDSALAVDVIATAYCLTGTMASGLEVYDGAIACPRYIPLKSKIETNGRTYICEDRMNLRFPDRYDIWMSDCDDCMEFGKRTLNIKIYNNL